MAPRLRTPAPVRVCASPRVSACVSPGLTGPSGPQDPPAPRFLRAHLPAACPWTCRALARTVAAQDWGVSSASPPCFSVSAFLSA